MRRRTSSRITSKNFKPHIFWSTTHLAYAVHAPYNEEFREEMKGACESWPRWEPEAKVWLVQEVDAPDVCTITEHYFGAYDFDPKPQSDHTSHASSNVDHYRVLFHAAGRELANEFYRKIMLRHHPDRGGDADIASNANVAWREIKDELK